MPVILGAMLSAAGVLLISMQELPFPGRFPGECLVESQNVTFVAPQATGHVLSILQSLAQYRITTFK
jgi:hypothetical protein